MYHTLLLGNSGKKCETKVSVFVLNSVLIVMAFTILISMARKCIYECINVFLENMITIVCFSV